jgi:hypothetical protein
MKVRAAALNALGKRALQHFTLIPNEEDDENESDVDSIAGSVSPLSSLLSDILPPVYLWHRYDIEAVSKLIGGEFVQYDIVDDGTNGFDDDHDDHRHVRNSAKMEKLTRKNVPKALQMNALNALLAALSPVSLSIPIALISYLVPTAFGYTEVNSIGSDDDFLLSRSRCFDKVTPQV